MVATCPSCLTHMNLPRPSFCKPLMEKAAQQRVQGLCCSKTPTGPKPKQPVHSSATSPGAPAVPVPCPLLPQPPQQNTGTLLQEHGATSLPALRPGSRQL